MIRPTLTQTEGGGFRVAYGENAVEAADRDEAWRLSGRIMPEDEAITILRNIDALSPGEQGIARARLQAYKEAADEQGRDPFESYHKRRSQQMRRTETLVIDGYDAWYAGLEEGEKAQQDKLNAAIGTPDADTMRRNQNIAVMAQLTGQHPTKLAPIYDAGKEAFAQQVFGQPAANDAEFHSLAKSYLTRQRDERALMEEMGDRAMRASLAGRSTWLQEFEGWQREAKADPRYRAEHADAYLKQWRDAARAIDEKIGPYRKDVAAVEAMLREKAEADDLDGELGPVWDAMQQLAKNPDRETRQLLIAALGARVESGGEAGREGSRLYGALQRGAGNLRDDALSGGIRLLSRLNDLIPGTDSDLNQAVRDDLDLFADIKDVIAGNIDPIKPMHGGWMGKTEQMFYDFAGSIPYTVAAIGGAGAMTMAGLAFSDQNYNELRRTNPDMSRGDAELIAAAAAPFQVFVERWVTQRTLGLGKRLPGIDRLVTRLSSPVGGGILTRFAAYGSAAAAAEYAEEKIQDVTPLALQEVYSALKSDVPGVDWSQFEVFDSRTFFAVLPFALVGAGATTASDWAGATYFKENPEVLKYLGVPEASIQAIAEATTARETTAAVRAAWDQRTEKADTLAEYADLARREADRQAAEARQAQRNPGTVRFERTEEGWAAVAPDGSRVETASFEQAQAARDEMMQAQGTGHSEAVRSMVDWFAQRAKPGESFEFDENFTTLAEQVAAGVTTEQEAFERVQIAERLSGGNFEGSQFVLGRNATEFKDGVFTSASRLYRGANVLTVIEEKGEGDVKRWLASGELSRDQIAGWLREWEDQTGDMLLAEEVTDQSLIEAWSNMVTSYATGRFKENEDAAPKRFSAALQTILNAYREFISRITYRAGELMRLRSEGRLNQDFETYLQRSIGLDESQVYAREIEAASGEIAGATFSVGPSQDAEYMAAVNRGEMDAAQRMVDAAAKAAGYRRVVEDSYEDGDELEPRNEVYEGRESHVEKMATEFADAGEFLGRPLLLVPNQLLTGSHRYAAAQKSGMLIPVVKLEGQAFEDFDNWFRETDTPTWGIDAYHWMNQREDDQLIDLKNARNEGVEGLDDAIALLEAEAMSNSGAREFDDFNGGIFTDEQRIKSADPVTYDESGNVIPLSQRFNTEDDRITYALAPAEYFQKVASKIDSKLRDPKSRREFFLDMRRRVADKGTAWIDNSGEFSTIKAVDARARQIEAELYEREMERVGELAFYEDAKTLDHPLLSRIRESIGNFMSRGEGVRRGYNEALWDDMPPMPSQLMGGTLTPDQISQALHADGLIRADDVPAMWAEIESALKSQRGLKEAIAEAKKAERAARKKAREEARDWAEKEKERVWKSAPQRDRQDLRRALATLEAMVAALPAEIRGKIGGFTALAKLSTERARMEELERRIDKIDRELDLWLRKDFTDQMEKLVDKASPKREPGKGTKGKVGVEGHRFFEAVEAAMLMDGEQHDAKIDEIEAKIVDPSKSAEQVDALLEEHAIQTAFGAWETRSAEEMAAGLDKAEEVYKDGRDKWNAVLAERREERKALRASAVEEAGGVPQQRDIQISREDDQESPIRFFQDTLGATYAFWQTLQRAVGNGSTARRIERQMRAATDARNDSLRAKEREFFEGMAEIFGVKAKSLNEYRRKVYRKLSPLKDPQDTEIPFFGKTTASTIKVPRGVAEEIIAGKRKLHGFSRREVDGLARQVEAAAGNKRKRVFQIERLGYDAPTSMRISQLQGVHLSMLWRHEPYQEAMRYHGYADETIDAIEAWLTPEAKAIRAWLADQYETGYDAINTVHKRRFGIDLPKIRNYAPGLFEHAGEQNPLSDPMATGLSVGGMNAGFTKRRRSHKAEPRIEDALAVFWSHFQQTNHWIQFSEALDEARAVLSMPETQKAITGNAGVKANKALQRWLTILETNGGRIGQEVIAFEQLMASTGRRFATYILAYRVSTLFKQASAAIASLADISAAEWMRGARRVLANPSRLTRMFDSPNIQRRLESGYSPEIRAAMAGLRQNPNLFASFLEKGMSAIAWTDAAFTTLSAAVAYDAHFERAKKAGASDAQAAAIAELETSITIGRTAQPAETMDKSAFEIQADSFTKIAAFMFLSEPRQKFAISIFAAMQGAGGKMTKKEAATKIITAWFLMPIITQTMGNIYADFFTGRGDEEDDDSNWEWEDYALAMTIGQSTGLPGYGMAIEGLVRVAFDEAVYTKGSPLSAIAAKLYDLFRYRRTSVGEGVFPWDRKDLDGNWDPERAWESGKVWLSVAILLSSAFNGNLRKVGPVADFINALGASTNALEAIFGAADNLHDTPEEIEERERRAKKREKESQ